MSQYPTSISLFEKRPYQEEAIQSLIRTFNNPLNYQALLVMATGLGKTYVAAEAVRRLFCLNPIKVLVVAHSNELVYQLERAFWPTLTAAQRTVIWNEHEKPSESDLNDSSFCFACLNSIASHIAHGGELPEYDLLIVDECHHVGGSMYENIFGATRAGSLDGPFLLGLTATPWRSDEVDIKSYFGNPVVSIDMVSGLRNGFLSNVDYRMYTDNIDWRELNKLYGKQFTPKAINRTLFISQWDDSVVHELQKAWTEQTNPRAIVFCGTIDHAVTMRDRINSLGFCAAEAIFSGHHNGVSLKPYDRNRILSDFHDGIINVVCAVDIFNEGVDVPDVNIIVFQRVTHSRRIFVQQLGRGLRLSAGKDKVIVLDFVSDIRRFAAGIQLKDGLSNAALPKGPTRVRLAHKVTFRRVGEEDQQSEAFLRNWIDDIAAVESAGEDTNILQYPPSLPGGKS